MNKRVLGIAGVVALTLIGATVVGRIAGEDAAAHAKERLVLVWPSLMNMPVNDRALLVGLAMTCHLEQRPAATIEVIACLKEAVDDPHVVLPKGVGRASARVKLDQLLRQQSV